MRILSIYYTHKPGGFCTRLYRLLNALAAEDHQVCYLCLDQPPAKLDSSVEFVRIPFPLKRRSGALFWLMFMAWAPWFMLCTAWSRKSERIVVFGAVYACLALPARLLTRARMVLFIRSLVFKINRITRKPELLCRLSDLCERIGLRAADLVVTMNQTMKDELQRFTGREIKCEILPNDVPSFPTKATEENPRLTHIKALKAAGKIIVVISGVFDQRKNLSLVLEAMAQLEKNVPAHQIALIVAGEGAELPAARKFASDRNLASIHFTGWIEGLAPLYSITSLVVHPALHEGMPNSVLEAWSQGVPALVARTAELQEMVPAESLWISPENATDLANRLGSIVHDPAELPRLKALTETCAQPLRFDWSRRAVSLVLSLSR